MSETQRLESNPHPIVHVVLINWNDYANTARCLLSLEPLHNPGLSVIVVDNGSQDGSLIQLRSEFPWATFLEAGSNLGFAGGNNVGIAHALAHGAQLIWVLNNDTTVNAQTLEAQLHLLRERPHVGIVGAMVYEFKNPLRVQVAGGGTVNLWTGRIRPHTRRSERLDYIFGASMLIRREVFEKIGLLDEGYFFMWEEVDFCFCARKESFELAAAWDAPVWHVGSASIAPASPPYAARFVSGLIRFMRKHAPLPIVPIGMWMAAKTLMEVLRVRPGMLAATWGAFFEAWQSPRTGPAVERKT